MTRAKQKGELQQAREQLSFTCATMAKQKGELQQAREQAKNGLHLAAVIHAEARYLCEGRVILYASAPAQRWQSQQSHDLRGRRCYYYYYDFYGDDYYY